MALAVTTQVLHEPAAELLLKLFDAGVDDPSSFPLITPLPKQAVVAGMRLLR